MDNNSIISNFTSQNNLSERKNNTGRIFTYPSIQQKKEEIIRKLTQKSMKNTS